MHMTHNEPFHLWIFSGEYSYSLDQFTEFGSEISDQRFIELLGIEFTEMWKLISQIPPGDILPGFAKISCVSSKSSGRSLGEIIASDIDSESLSKFLNSHQIIFTELWISRSSEPLVNESFRIYWDNIFQMGGEKLRLFLESGTKESIEFGDLLRGLIANSEYGDIISNIINRYTVTIGE